MVHTYVGYGPSMTDQFLNIVKLNYIPVTSKMKTQVIYKIPLSQKIGYH